MQTIPCPTCNKMIAEDAGTCPKCGHPMTDADRSAGRRFNKRTGIGCLTVIVIIALFNLFGGSSEPDPNQAAVSYQLQEPDTAQAMPYVVLEANSGTVGAGGFLMTEASIQVITTTYPVTEKMLADTAVKATWELRKESKASFVRTFLVIDSAHIGQGDVLAHVEFSPRKEHADGSAAPTWVVTTVAKPIPQDRWESFSSEGLGVFGYETITYKVE